MRNHTVTALSLILTAILCLGLTQAALAKGKPVRVEVTDAYPGDAFQGEELDVTVTGAGFDAQSSVSYLVTGTTDASQVDVLSVQYVSDSELKTRIRPKDNAAVTDYDIEVQNSSGRKGKGTTLFRVKAVETACTGLESKEPEIAYLTGFDTSGEVHTQDLYLSSGSGCDQYLLIEDAVQALPIENGPNGMQGEHLQDVDGLRLAIQNGVGIVTWIDRVAEPSTVTGLLFSYSPSGSVQLDPAGPMVLYQSSSGAYARNADVRFNSSGELELAIIERASGAVSGSVVFFSPGASVFEVLGTGCIAFDSDGTCYNDPWAKPYWSSDGTQVFFQLYSNQSDSYALARIRRSNGSWLAGEVLMTDEEDIQIRAVSDTDSLVYRFTEIETRKNGKIAHRDFYTAMIDSALCELAECVPRDGDILPIDLDRFSGGWTRSGGLLFLDVQAVDKANISEYLDPYTGQIGSLRIIDVDYYERDTAF